MTSLWLHLGWLHWRSERWDRTTIYTKWFIDPGYICVSKPTDPAPVFLFFTTTTSSFCRIDADGTGLITLEEIEVSTLNDLYILVSYVCLGPLIQRLFFFFLRLRRHSDGTGLITLEELEVRPTTVYTQWFVYLRHMCISTHWSSACFSRFYDYDVLFCRIDSDCTWAGYTGGVGGENIKWFVYPSFICVSWPTVIQRLF